MDKVSIMMCCFNNVQFIKQAIESIQGQTHKNWELIISDDQSSDGTYELACVLASKDDRIKVFQNAQNLGTAKNRHAAAKHLTGDFVCHVDSDDALERWALEEMLLYFAKLPDIMLLYSDFAQIGIDNKVQVYCQSKDFDREILHQHGWRHFGIYRSKVLKEIYGYNDKLITCEDGDLFMQIAEKYDCAHVPKVLYYYRAHGNNASQKNSKCEDCNLRKDCNYIRVWSKAAKYDPVTFKPL